MAATPASGLLLHSSQIKTQQPKATTTVKNTGQSMFWTVKQSLKHALRLKMSEALKASPPCFPHSAAFSAEPLTSQE